MHTSVFVYTTASVTSATPRADTRTSSYRSSCPQSALVGQKGQVRSGQVLLGRSLGPRGPSEKNVRELTERRCPTFLFEMSNELESDRAMEMNLESFGVDGVGYDETETEPPSSTNPQ